MNWLDDVLAMARAREAEAQRKQDEHERLVNQPMLPCPFCGGQGALTMDTPSAMAGSIVTYAFVKCQSCGAQGKKCDDWTKAIGSGFLPPNTTYKQEAIDVWNKRKAGK